MSATAPARSARPRPRTSITAPPSNLDVHDLLDRKRARHDHDRADHEHDPPGGMREERPHVGRIDRGDREEKADGQERDDPAGEAPLRGQAADETAESLPLADALDAA